MTPVDQHAVIDRLEGAVAVVLVGDDEVVHHLAVADLPEGAGEGSVLRVRVEEDGLTVVAVDEAERTERAHDLAGRLERLRQRRPSGRLRRGDSGGGDG